MVWFLLALVAMRLTDRYFPAVEFSWAPLRVAGGALFVLAAGLFIGAAIALHRKNTTVDPFGEATALATESVFRISRNPIYLAMVLILSGGALQMGSLAPWIFVVAFVWIIQTQYIVQEERFLATTFPDSYADYCNRVRRWI